MEFIPAKKLKERFITFGSYYRLEVKEIDKSIPCRDTLEIYDKTLLNSGIDTRVPFVC